MAFIPRIFVPKESLIFSTVRIEGADANHIKNVLRIPLGGAVTVCDGEGSIYPSSVIAYEGKTLSLSLGKKQAGDGELPFSVTVYQCLPKGEKTDTVVQKSVELGAHGIVFVASERCVARPDAKAMEKKVERLSKIAEGAASQSGRSILPRVRGTVPFAQACSEAATCDLAFLCYEGSGTRPLRELVEAHPNVRSVAFVIGPEGGISDLEVETAVQAGLSLAGLGSRILRTETAPLFVLSALNVLY